jgi:hypothetical protein
MGGPIGSSEIRVAIQRIGSYDPTSELIPARLFKKTFDAFLAALLAADREVHGRARASEFFVSHLSVEGREFGIVEQERAPVSARPSAVELFKLFAGRVYRSDYQVLQRYPRLTRTFRQIIRALGPSAVALVRHSEGELPVDSFFRRQLERVREPGAASRDDMWFAGAAIATFVGRLEAIDYRGPLWKGALALEGDGQLECVFDKSKGADAFNRFGNKSVSVSGRAIYTGDSPAPERIEVLNIEESPPAGAALEVRSALPPVPGDRAQDRLDGPAGVPRDGAPAAETISAGPSPVRPRSREQGSSGPRRSSR